MYRIKLDNNARKELDKIDFEITKRIIDRIKSLENEPRPFGSIKSREKMLTASEWEITGYCLK